jgi:hypothetical protein
VPLLLLLLLPKSPSFLYVMKLHSSPASTWRAIYTYEFPKGKCERREARVRTRRRSHQQQRVATLLVHKQNPLAPPTTTTTTNSNRNNSITHPSAAQSQQQQVAQAAELFAARVRHVDDVRLFFFALGGPAGAAADSWPRDPNRRRGFPSLVVAKAILALLFVLRAQPLGT